MNWLRLIGLALAAGLHGAVYAALVAAPPVDELSLADGSGADRLTVVATVSLDGSDLFTQAASAGASASEARPEPEQTPAAPEPQPAPEPRPEAAVEAEPERAPPPKPAPPEPVVEQVSPAPPPQAATAARAAQDEQRAAAQIAARRSKLWTAYQKALHRAIERAKIRTQTSRAAVVKVVVRIAPSGELLSHEIVESSGVAALDRAAVASLQRAAPFPPIPPEVSAGPLALTVPFDYRVR
jgi:protein TonB